MRQELGWAVTAAKLTFSGLLLLFASIVVAIGLLLIVSFLASHCDANRKATQALESGFPRAAVSINDSEKWDHFNQICFDVTVRPESGGLAERKIVMVSGDDDGGTWMLSRLDYRSMSECKDDFNRG